MATGKRHMTDRDQLATDPGPTDLSARLEEAINKMTVGLLSSKLGMKPPPAR